MVQKRNRLPVVLDTNIFITRWLRHNPQGANRRVYDLWRERRELQLIVSEPIILEYTQILLRFGKDAAYVAMLEHRLRTASNVTYVNLGTRFNLCRDPKDNMLLDTAFAGQAQFLISNDKDLLDIPATDLHGLRFEILRPPTFLDNLGF